MHGPGLGWGLLGIVFFVAVLTGVIIKVRHRAIADRLAEAQYPQLVHLRKITLVSRYAGGLLALIAVAIWMNIPFSSPSIGVLPALAGSLIIVCITLGELLVFNRAQEKGVASLEQRRLLDWLPTKLIFPSGICLIFLILFIVLDGMVMASGGRAWYSPLTSFGLRAEMTGSATYPFYGWAYFMPVIIATVVCLAFAGIGIWTVATRPRNGADSVLAQWDDALRRRSMRGIGAAVLFTFAANVTYAAYMSLGYNALPDIRHYANISGIPQSTLSSGTHLLWYSTSAAHIVLWVIIFASIFAASYAAGLIFGDTVPVLETSRPIRQTSEVAA